MTAAAIAQRARIRLSLSRLIVLVPLALAAAWLILRQALILLALSSPDRVLPQLWPPSGKVVIAESGVRTSVIGPNRSRLDRIFLSAPLASDPFYLAGSDRARRGDHRGAIRLLEEARRREPRWVAPRVLLAQQYLMVGNINGAVNEITTLARLGTGADAQLFNALLKLSADPQARMTVVAALGRDPFVRRSFVRYVATHGGDPAILFKALIDTPDASSSADEQAAIVGMLADNQDYERAYLAWINFLPHAALSQTAFIYDGNFTRLPGVPPFNWSVVDNDAASTDFVRKSDLPQGTALAVNYYGEKPAAVAQQLLMLEPGDYSFFYSVVGSRDGNFGGGSLGWSLRCAGTDEGELLRSLLVPSHPTQVQVNFSVPAGCPAQILSLRGAPGDVPTVIDAQYSGLAIKRRATAGAAQNGQGTPP